MRMPPDLNGHGGSQRAWHLLEALRPHGDIHFVLLFRDQDKDCIGTSLAPLAGRVASVTRINIPDWQTAEAAKWKLLHPRLWDLLRVRCIEAPRFSRAVLRQIAAQLPLRDPDLIFAGRLCCAVILQDLIGRRLLQAPRRVVDFDDIMSKFRRRQAAMAAYRWKWRAVAWLDSWLIRRGEDRIAASWDAVSVCTEEDADDLRATHAAARVFKVPNISARGSATQGSPPRPPDGRFRVLFVGNLSFAPNVAGLTAFVEQAWPRLRQAVPEAVLTVVGFCPLPEIRRLAQRAGFALHADAACLDPFYRDCDVAIAPILFGSGTRIKILEAMAHGRAVVATSIGAEGLSLAHGRHLLIADSMPDFARALAALARDPLRRSSLAAAAHAFQQRHFGPRAIAEAVAGMLRPATPLAAPRVAARPSLPAPALR